MRLALTVALAALIAAAGVWLLSRPGPAPEPSAPARAAPPPGSAEELAMLTAGSEPAGYGPAGSGVVIRREGRGAVLALPGGVELALTPPQGQRLRPRFTVLSARSGGFVLEGPEGRAVYISFAHAGRRMEPSPPATAATFYEQIAERIREEGTLPFKDRSLPVSGVRASAAGVFYCLTDRDGTPYQGGTRFVGPVSATAMRAGACAAETGLLERRLDLAEATLAGNR